MAMGKTLVAPAIALACASLVPAQATPRGSTTPSRTTVSKNAQQMGYAVKGRVKSACAIPVANRLSLSTVAKNGDIDNNLANARWSIPGWACNTASALTVSATALRLTVPRTTLNPSQSQVINFRARASGWSRLDATVSTSETSPLGQGLVFTGAPAAAGSRL